MKDDTIFAMASNGHPPHLHLKRTALFATFTTLMMTVIGLASGQQPDPAVWPDPDTKLMWATKDSGPYEPPSYGLLRQAGAAAYCKDSRLAGFRDWRLPTIEELQQIYDKSVEGYHVKGGVIKPNGDPTGKTPYVYASMNVWSQSVREDQGNIWEFNFKYGSRMTTVGGAGAARALCVRGAPVPAPAKTAAGPVDLSKYVSTEGITIPTGRSSPGSGVYFSTNEGYEMSMSLQGNPAIAMLKYTGTIEPSNDGKVGGGTDKFKPTQIQTSKNLNKWLKVVSFSLSKDGFLVVKDESGSSYTIKVSIGTGTINELR